MNKTLFLVIILLTAANSVLLLAQPAPQTVKLPLAKPPADEEVISVDTNLVTVPVKVLDRGGRFIGGLKKNNFKLWEDDVEQEIEYFSKTEEPFTVALILDMSPSSTFKIHEIQSAAKSFIEQLRPDDRVMIVSFDAEVKILSEPSNDRQKLQKAIEKSQIGFGTSLYEAVDFVINKRFKKIKGRKAVVLFSDGVDTTSIKADSASNLEDSYELDALIYPIEYNTFGDVQKMKKRADVVPSALNPPSPNGKTGGQGTTAEDYRRARDYLKELAVRTSGRVYRADNPAKLSLAFSKIAGELRQTYSLSYYPSAAKKEKKRKLKVRVNQKGYVVRARDSYIVHNLENKTGSK